MMRTKTREKIKIKKWNNLQNLSLKKMINQKKVELKKRKKRRPNLNLWTYQF